jgi:hypothetical protein
MVHKRKTNNPEKLATYGTQEEDKMDNPEKLATYSTQEEDKQSRESGHILNRILKNYYKRKV